MITKRRPAPVIIKNREIKEEKQYNECPEYIKSEIDLYSDDKEYVIITRTCNGSGTVGFSAIGYTMSIIEIVDTTKLCEYDFFDSYEEYRQPKSDILYLGYMTEGQAEKLIEMLVNDIVYATKLAKELREISYKYEYVKCRMAFDNNEKFINVKIETLKSTKEYKIESHKDYYKLIDKILKEDKKKEL